MHRYLIIFLISALTYSCGHDDILKEIRASSYPSASGIEYLDDKFYVIGDDANSLLVLDSNLAPVDSILLYHFQEKRIPKAFKADLESILITPDKKLLVIGSGSVDSTRSKAWLIDPATKQKDSLDLGVFYQRLKESGIKEINIEGSTAVPGNIILSNRGNKAYPRNQLIITSINFWQHQTHAPFTVIPIGTNTDSTRFNGVSGLAYSRRSDKLILTVSTEDTRSSVDDGAIGKSYLWIVNSFSSKKNWNAINPNQVTELDAVDARFRGQKIESVCVTGETKHFLQLVLVADNDNGSSTFFRMLAEKN